jgi:integrase
LPWPPCRSEAANLTADAVPWQEHGVVLQKLKTAHRGKIRVIYLSDEALTILHQQQEEHRIDHRFRRSSGGKWTTHRISGMFARVCRKAGVKVTASFLRHTFATDALANGVPGAKTVELLGHSGAAILHRHHAHLMLGYGWRRRNR